MKKIISMLFISSVLCFAANAQQTEKKVDKSGATLGIGIDGVLPIGDFGKINSFGIGGSLKGAFPVGNSGDITLTAGYINFSYKKPFTGSLGLIPIKAGYRFRTMSGFYGEPQAGYGKFTNGGGGGFLYAINAGYLDKSGFDIAARYEGISNNGSISYVGLRVGYNFHL
ncbi:MAG: hypothetical protein WAU24_14500 [Chitinophagaceae bacterium]